MRPAHLHFFRPQVLDRLFLIDLAPFGLPKLSRAHEQMQRELERHQYDLMTGVGVDAQVHSISPKNLLAFRGD